MPTYGSTGAACFDLYPSTSGTVEHGHPRVFGTGIAVEIPPGFGLFVFSRSGHGFKYDVRLANGTGIIDSDYRGEIMVKLTCDAPGRCFEIEPDKAIAQAVILPCPQVSFVEVDELNSTERGAGGFGSTDKYRTGGVIGVSDDIATQAALPLPGETIVSNARQKMERALCDLKDYAGATVAKQIMGHVGGVAKMCDIPDDLVEKVTAAAELRTYMEGILSDCQRLGLVLTVSQVAKRPLAMGNYKTEVSIRAARESA
jgi:dUTP pyrophosphatase